MKEYRENMIDLLEELNIAVPEKLHMDQKQVSQLIAEIKEKVDPPTSAPGNATVGDVREGVTFSSSEGLELVGTLVANEVLSRMPEPVVEVMRGNVIDIGESFLFLVMGMAEVEVHVDDTLVATLDEATLGNWVLDDYLTEEPLVFEVVLVPVDGVTLSPSEAAQLSIDTVEVVRNLTSVTDTNEQDYALVGVDFGGLIQSASETYPNDIQVEVGQDVLVEGQDYTYNNNTGEYLIYGKNIDDTLTITAALALS